MLSRLQSRFKILPTAIQLFECSLLACVFLALTYLVAPEFTDLSATPPLSETLVVALVAFIIPSLVEEVIFRGILLPTFSPFWLSLSLVLYVLWHPLEAHLFFPDAVSTFTDPMFLSLVAILGCLCTFAYFRTKSIWASIYIHWLVVVAWKASGGLRVVY